MPAVYYYSYSYTLSCKRTENKLFTGRAHYKMQVVGTKLHIIPFFGSTYIVLYYAVHAVVLFLLLLLLLRYLRILRKVLRAFFARSDLFFRGGRGLQQRVRYAVIDIIFSFSRFLVISENFFFCTFIYA